MNEAAAAFRRAAELCPELEEAAGAALAVAERQTSRERCLVVLQGHHGAIYDAAAHPQVGAQLDPQSRPASPAGAELGYREVHPGSIARQRRAHHRMLAPTRRIVQSRCGLPCTAARHPRQHLHSAGGHGRRGRHSAHLVFDNGPPAAAAERAQRQGDRGGLEPLRLPASQRFPGRHRPSVGPACLAAGLLPCQAHALQRGGSSQQQHWQKWRPGAAAGGACSAVWSGGPRKLP